MYQMYQIHLISIYKQGISAEYPAVDETECACIWHTEKKM